MNEFEITLTEEAAKIISDVISDQQVEEAYLAVYVSGGGCSGLQYSLAIAEGEPEIDDVIVFDKDIKIAVEYNSAKYLHGAIINYEEKGMMSGFKVENPNANKSCGCGKSFSISGDEIDACGGCGHK
jgi:iron-sulfur cluster assembly protein